MLRHLGIILSTLTIVHQCASRETLVCNNIKGTINLWDDDGACKCTVAPSSNFGEGYKYIPGIGVYKFHTDAKTWNDARNICMKESAHLAILSSPAEGKALQEELKKEYGKISGARSNQQVWLGVHDQFFEGDWVTVLGDPLISTDYVGWNNESSWGKQPDNTNVQNCASLIRTTGMMDDVQCDWALGFFCEKPDKCS